MIKKIMSFLICVVMLFSVVPVHAAGVSVSGPDIIITDVRINNPYFTKGSDIRFEVDIKNIGNVVCPSGWIWVEVKSGATKRAGGTGLGLWSKKSLYPGETITWSLTDYVAEAEEITAVFRCDSASSVAETDENNNAVTMVFKKQKSNPDLIITDFSLNVSEFKAGDLVDANVKLKNKGDVDIPYSEVEGELNIGKYFREFKTVQEISAGEEISFTIPDIPVPSNPMPVDIQINPDKKITEVDYSNNTLKKDIYSIEETDYNWDHVRIGGGGYVPYMAVQAYDPDAVYIATDVGGALRYDSSLDEWVPITDGLMYKSNNYRGCAAITTDPEDSNIVYLMTGMGKSGAEGVVRHSGIFRSMDKGKTFTDMHVPPGDIVGSKLKSYKTLLAVDPNNTNILYAVCPLDGLYRTENAKDKVPKWEKLNVPDFVPAKDYNGMMTSIAIDPNTTSGGKSSTIYVSTMTGGIYKSENAGGSFELMEGSSLKCKQMKVLSNGDLYACVSMADGGIVKFDGNEWTSIVPYKDREYTCFDVSPFDENMFVASSSYDIHYSDNGGLTWRSTALRTVSDYEFEAPWHVDSKFANNIGFVYFDRVNNHKVWFGDWFGVWITEDISADRVKWRSKVKGLEEFCVRNIMPTSGEARLFIGAMDNCGVTSTDVFEFPNEGFLNPKYQDTNCIDFAEKTPNIVARIGGNGWGAKDGNGGYSLDGGFTWEPFETYPLKLNNSGDKANNGYLAVAAEPNDDGVATILATPIKHFVFRTTDYGKTWTKVEDLPQNLYADFNDYNDPIEADSVNKDVFYAYEAATGNFYVSRDNGATFSNISKLPKADRRHYILSVPGKEGEVFAAIGRTGLWYSSNYGKTFEKIPTVNGLETFSIGKESPKSQYPTLYIYGDVNGVEGYYRSIDFGKTWEKISEIIPDAVEPPWQLKADRKDFGVFYTVTGGNGVNIAIPKGLDIKIPEVVINSKLDGQIVRDNPYTIEGTVTEPATVYLKLNGKSYEAKTDEKNKFAISVELSEGENTAVVSAVDDASLPSDEEAVTFTYDPSYIGLNLDQSSGLCMEKEFTLTGSVSVLNESNKVLINNNAVSVNPKTRKFAYTSPIYEGINKFEVTAYDDAGNKTTKTIEMNYDVTPPSVSFKNAGIVTESPLYLLEAKLSEACTITVEDYSTSVQPGESLDISLPIELSAGVNNLKVSLKDPAGNTAETEVSAEYKPKEVLPNNKDEVMVYNTSASTPVIDGEITDGEWYLNRVANRLLSGNTNSYALFGVKGDSKYLYFAAKVWDDKVTFGTGKDHDADSVELFFDPELNRATKFDPTDHQVRFGLSDNTTVGVVTGTEEDVKMAYSLTDFGYIIEVALPWKAVDVKYFSGAKIGFDVSINDNSQGEGQSRDGAYGWRGTAYNYNNTADYGTAIMQ